MRHQLWLLSLALIIASAVAGARTPRLAASPRDVAPAVAHTEAGDPLGKIDPELLQQFAEAEEGAHLQGAPGEEAITYLVHLSERAPLDDLLGMTELTDRRRLIASRLQASAARSQGRAVNVLERARRGGGVVAFRSYWIINGLAVDGDLATALELASLPEVESIQPNRVHRLPEPPALPADDPAPGADAALSAWGPTWGIQKIGADRVWAELGITGEGVVVANMDSGVDWTHPALQRQYRGFNADNPAASSHDYHWFDATGIYPSAPGPTQACGSSAWNHGTHTMGTLLGATQDGSEQIGVAPGARWIAVKVFGATSDPANTYNAGLSYDEWIIAGFQWCLAPTDLAGNNPDPAMAPDVVSNSWGSTDASDDAFLEAVDNLRAAGILTVFAAGNSGPGDGSINAPGSYTSTLAVGATDAVDTIAYFSSRGPTPWGAVKPDVSAPGTSVRSSIAGGGYANSNGTSMATPHVAGLAALLWEANHVANPEVGRTLSVTATEYLITRTAVDLGTPGHDNTYGWGRIDAYRAVERTLLGDLSTSHARFGVSGLLRGSATTLRFTLVKIGGFDATATLTCTVPSPLTVVTDSLHASTGEARIEGNNLTWEGLVGPEGEVLVELSVWAPPDAERQEVNLLAYLTDVYGNTPHLSATLRIVPYMLRLPLVRQNAP
ncbi:MAG: S8 family serine peptidase [Anaerolineae bacterium]